MTLTRLRPVRLLLAASGIVVGVGLAAALGFYLAFLRDLPELHRLDDYRPPLTSRVVDRNGAPIGEFFVERRQITPYDEIPDHAVRAFVAGEDSTFFEHSGIDFVSILRAAWVNLLAGGEIRQGGSTITQQMVKGLLLTPERNIRRKLREMILARDIEQRFSKQEILYLYLNQIYFGHGAYGIGEAARTYFDKDVTELSVSEAAQLAGLPKAPSRYSPYSNPEQAEKRRLYVLERMLAEGFLDKPTFAAAVADAPVLREPTAQKDFTAAAYFTEEVRRQLFEMLGGDKVLKGGLVIETTLDIDLQRAAVAAVRGGLQSLSKRQGYHGPLRRVAEAEIPTEIERLAAINGLADSAGSAGEFAGPELALIGNGPFEGVITSVEPEQKLARVAFGPGLEGFVRLSDVSWGRTPNPKKAPYRVRKIEHVFEVGDVARFQPRELSQKAGDPEGGLRVTLFQAPRVEGALVSIDVHAQEIIALVGGYDFERSQFNRVTQAKRQPGSAFKPLIYGAAIEQGYTPATIVFDRPIVYTDEESGFVWRPRNYGRAFYGPITLRDALARSVNNATVHLFRDVGVDYVISYARQLGIESPLNRDLSLALGSSDLSLLELTRAYATFPAAGQRVTPVYIRRVTDSDGKILVENLPLGRTPSNNEDVAKPASEDTAAESQKMELAEGAVISPENAYLVADLLRAVVSDPDGTGWRLRALGRPVAGKTGTTNDQADAWFLGFSPGIATGVWVGHDESRFLGWGETGSRAAAPIWLAFMKAALAKRRVRDFPVPEPIVFARIDRKTGLLADESSDDSVFQSFLADTVPTETSSKAQNRNEGRRLLRLDDF
ncbi:MAG: PBP1A family penicillin-binding protein [Myxococcota bacterium]|jgi:penicillin-binding protein 1A|nr:penicillin-binding protein [Deltaproteobacteria bacterium]MCP4243878.1 PBP1A family penicillin-binding protein [bacterium]MDP6073523.1 PBP1A family penicillin-binding protein [Myxococcota bacterium]MDP6243388.1 PBP1A family penicillin-binding protein [Myxococcota bacterium]MDP7076156.1 PBP1A family penicillin-binding protein [Myxococcota bacterium]